MAFPPIRIPAFWHAAVYAILCALAAQADALETLVAGRLTDAATGQPVAGASIQVSRGATAVAAAISDESGRFIAPLAMDGNARLYLLVLTASHDDFVAKTLEIQLVDGAPTENLYTLDLLPRALAPCLAGAMHKIVVGYFRSPPSEPIDDIAGRLAEVLHFDLLTRVQAMHLPADLQPVFAPCEGARPGVVTQGKQLARVLSAHAFLHGNVAKTANQYQVSTYVSDAYDLSAGPSTATSESVDISNPSAARMNPDTYVAVLAALAAGLIDERNCVGALAVANAAESLAASTPDFVRDLRRRCELP